MQTQTPTPAAFRRASQRTAASFVAGVWATLGYGLPLATPAPQAGKNWRPAVDSPPTSQFVCRILPSHWQIGGYPVPQAFHHLHTHTLGAIAAGLVEWRELADEGIDLVGLLIVGIIEERHVYLH